MGSRVAPGHHGLVEGGPDKEDQTSEEPEGTQQRGAPNLHLAHEDSGPQKLIGRGI